MAYFGADLQSANNILKTTEFLVKWEFINKPENHFIIAKKKDPAKKRYNKKYTRNDKILQTFKITLQTFYAKNSSKKTLNIREKRRF